MGDACPCRSYGLGNICVRCAHIQDFTEHFDSWHMVIATVLPKVKRHMFLIKDFHRSFKYERQRYRLGQTVKNYLRNQSLKIILRMVIGVYLW